MDTDLGEFYRKSNLRLFMAGFGSQEEDMGRTLLCGGKEDGTENFTLVCF